jgi:hypothetical protein
MLGKVFDMSGLFKGAKRQAEPENGFRRAMNVWQDRTGKWRPKGEQAAFNTPTSPFSDTSILRTGFSRRFKDGIFSCYMGNYNFAGAPYSAASTKNFFQYVDKTGADITPVWNSSSANLAPDWGDWSFGRDSYPNVVVGNKIFFKAGTLPLLKFDGVQVVRAGLPCPELRCTSYNTAGIERYIRAVNVRIGFDGGLVSSQYLQFPVNTGGTTTMNFQSGTPNVKPGVSKCLPSSSVSPSLSEDLMDDLAIVNRGVTALWTVGATTITTPHAGCQNVTAGRWVIFAGYTDGSGYTSGEGLGYLYALKVISVTNPSGIGVVTFDINGKYYSRANLTWLDRKFTGTEFPFNAGASGGGSWGASIWTLLYSSSGVNPTGAFTLCGQIPLLPTTWAVATYFTIQYTYTGVTDYFGGQTSADLASWYDLGTIKIPFPYQFDGYKPGIVGLTKYQGLLLSYDRNAIYFSDTSGGGSDEMISGLSNFVPLGSEYGGIVCVEGCEDFIFISRERKNYVLVGDIASGNFTIAECDSETSGAFGSTSGIAIKGGVAYMSRQGIFFCTSSGQISEFSVGLSRLFGTAREFTTDPDNVSFRPYLMTDLTAPSSSTAFDGWDGNIVKMKYDPDRGLLGILYGKKYAVGAPATTDKYSILAINLNTGAVFEWKTDSTPNDIVVTDLEFLGHYDQTTGKFKGSLVQCGAALTREDITATRGSKRFFLTSWLTGGEPSLEKQAKQVKFYGQMTSCQIYHQENWEGFTSLTDIAAPRTNATYPSANNQNANLFEHKQRLNTSRCQAVSIGFEPLDDNFSLEGYEIEWDLIQETVKK